ncbi:MAG: 3'-5' exonuclease, partial [Litorivicinus sp.]
SDKNSLFAQPEAVDVLAWLKLAADPSDDRRLRSAVITASLGLAWSDLDRLMGDGDAWERFREQALVWGAMAQAGGLQSMFMELWAYFGVRERLLDSQRGARTFANLMQLAEWCQRAWPEQGSVSSLIRALERLMLEPDNTDVQRMETDQDVVQIVTVHKSKGLEYPVVVAPFLCVADPVSDSAPAVVARTPAGRLLSVVGGKAAPEHWAAADEERLQEDLRLLYVAVTRAKHLLLACAGPLKSGLDKSAVGSLLGVGKGADLAETLSQLSSGGDLGLHHGPLALEPKPRSLPSGKLKAALTPSFRLPPRRWVASFTALTRRLEQGEETPYAAHWHDEQSPSAESAPSPPAADSDASSGVLTDFPRGPEAGTFLHSVIEWAHTAGFTRVASEHEWRLATLQTMAVARGYGDHTSQLDQWLVTMLNTEFVGFGAGPMCLSRQPPAIAEFEFLLGMGRLPVRRLDEFCQSRILPGRPRAALSAADLNGFMKGFIDWVVEHEGRYWLVDWKSNDLAGDYSGGAMEQAVLGHRYDVQMAIYLVALHRHLTSRLPHYDPGRHLGGAAYCFLRGTQSPSQGMHWCSGDMTWVAECSELLRPEVFQ